MSDIEERLIKLAPDHRAVVLLKIIQIETIYVRELYYRDLPDHHGMFQISELIHRISGYLIRLTEGAVTNDETQSMVSMVVKYLEIRDEKYHRLLNSWIQY